MQRNKGFLLGDLRISICALILVIFGSLMIASAEMGTAVGNTAYLSSVITRQLIYAVIGIIAYFLLMHLKVYRFPIFLYYLVYVVLLIMLLACRLFGQINGAYAWIQLGAGATIQPSEFAKVFMIGFGARLFAKDNPEKNISHFWTFAGLSILYAFVIVFIQHDFGSGIVLAMICYCILLVPSYKEIKTHQNWMILIILVVVALALIVLSPPVTELLKKHSDNYMIGRFLAAADPFLYQYDNGYHIIMSLVSFANGGLFGLGYGNSIHKYMNFPNPSNDFILPVIVEELGIIGFVLFIIVYLLMLYPIVMGSLKSKIYSSKMVFLGVSLYFVVHFILNVGGVSGLIPLTGVPLLMISSGGSSLMACLSSLGLAQGEIARNIEN